MKISDDLLKVFYPDARHSGTHFFYDWIRRTCQPNCLILNLGAGPGDREGAADLMVRDLRHEGRKVCACDLDSVVLRNRQADECRLMEGEVIPYGAGEFHIVFCDYVLEHVAQPLPLFKEVWRVLKPGGHFFFRTPNLFHYVTIMSRLSPQSVHDLLANRARGLPPESRRPYPTFYRMNTLDRISRYAEKTGFRKADIVRFEGEPSYLMFHIAPFVAGVVYERIVNRVAPLGIFRSNLIGCLTK